MGGIARVIIDSLDFHPIASSRTKEKFHAARYSFVESALRLENAGPEFIAIACNTVHRFAQAISDAASIPLLHIADAVGDALIRDGHEHIGLLGTSATTQGAFYREYWVVSE